MSKIIQFCNFALLLSYYSILCQHFGLLNFENFWNVWKWWQKTNKYILQWPNLQWQINHVCLCNSYADVSSQFLFVLWDWDIFFPVIVSDHLSFQESLFLSKWSMVTKVGRTVTVGQTANTSVAVLPTLFNYSSIGQAPGLTLKR